MKKRLILLLTLVVVVLTIAPLAMADHCRVCRSTLSGPRCGFATTGGYPSCEIIGSTCQTSGTWCTGPHPFIEEDFGADFVVAAVERLDEPKPPADETRVASLEPSPATR